jgi:hypothetical protein
LFLNDRGLRFMHESGWHGFEVLQACTLPQKVSNSTSGTKRVTVAMTAALALPVRHQKGGGGRESDLQVEENAGWMLDYSCSPRRALNLAKSGKPLPGQCAS